MKIFSSKKRVAAIGVVTAATLVGGGMAYAYWTNGGAGTGTADTGTTTDNLVITASGPVDLVPGGGPQALALSVDNTANTYSVRLTNQTVAIVPTSITCDGLPAEAAWFSLPDATIDSLTTVAAGSPGTVLGGPTGSGVTIQMENTADNQDVCQDALVEFDLTVS